MWDGVTYVDPTHDPIIHEGFAAATVVVTNAGPNGVFLRGWQSFLPGSADPIFKSSCGPAILNPFRAI